MGIHTADGAKARLAACGPSRSVLKKFSFHILMQRLQMISQEKALQVLVLYLFLIANRAAGAEMS